MELIERATYLDILQYRYEDAKKGMGNCVLLTGEAGMGKSLQSQGT
ncbi:MAG: ATP-binding protein [Bacteroidota bacterium]|nr:ATP-binding protein [Bacteroidota bacterium]